jgi:sec-independent protein translocase protein TatC
MQGDMPLLSHLMELRSRLLRVVVCVIFLSIFCATFGLKSAELNGFRLVYPFPDPFHNIAIQLTFYMSETLLPQDVELIQTAPGQAFFAQIHVSFLIGIIGSMPVIIKEIFGFISPAIESNKMKRIGIVNVFLPVITLFIIGIIFSYLLVIPTTLNFLYQYGQAIGVATFLTINEFISFVLQFFLGFGIAFELPMIMYAIALTDTTESYFWRRNFKYAFIVFVVFGAIITPDGGGVTLWLFALPMVMLYAIGMVAIERREKKKVAASASVRTTSI